MRLFLIRHGAVDASPPGAFYGGCDVPLSREGREEALAAAGLLAGRELVRILCSPLARARFGAECVAAGRSGVRIEEVDAFREIDRGHWVGWTPAQIQERFPGELEAHESDPENWAAHGGESLGQLRDRVLGARATLLDGAAHGDVALVSHLWPTRALLADALGLDLGGWTSVKVPTGSVHCVERTTGRAWRRVEP